MEDFDDLVCVVVLVYDEYQWWLWVVNVLDFDDLIGEIVVVLQVFLQIVQYYCWRFWYVLVDEYQDINYVQYVLVCELVGCDSNDGIFFGELCVVGDVDQLIYVFCGVIICNIEDFECDYFDIRIILLEQNYCLMQNILLVVNLVIVCNVGCWEKWLWIDVGVGELIVGYVVDNEYDEVWFVVEEIDVFVEGSEIIYNDVVVFYCINNLLWLLEEVLICVGILYKVVGGVCFYECKEICDIVVYLCVLDNLGDVVSLWCIFNILCCGIGDCVEVCVVVYVENIGVGFGDVFVVVV